MSLSFWHLFFSIDVRLDMLWRPWAVAQLQCTQRSLRQVTSRTPRMLICLQQGKMYPHETGGRDDMRSGDRSIRNEARCHASAATACLAGPSIALERTGDLIRESALYALRHLATKACRLAASGCRLGASRRTLCGLLGRDKRSLVFDKQGRSRAVEYVYIARCCHASCSRFRLVSAMSPWG